MEGDPEVEKYMGPVDAAIKRHLTGEAATDVYNRCYEAVLAVVQDTRTREKQRLERAEAIRAVEGRRT